MVFYRQQEPEFKKLQYQEAPKANIAQISKVHQQNQLDRILTKIPKTGYYKNRPFWGTWEERNNIRLIFKDELLKIKSRVKIILWTDYLLNDKKQLDFRHMEKPQSVHLSRSSYPYWTGDRINTLENFME